MKPQRSFLFPPRPADEARRAVSRPVAEDVEAALAAAWSLFEAGGQAAALARLRDLAETHPGHAAAQGALGEVCLALGRDADAAAAFAAALVPEPGHLSHVRGLALALDRCGRPETALAAWQKRLARRPDCRLSLAAAAELAVRAGKTGVAEGHWRALLDLDPCSAEALEGLAALRAGQGRLPEAIELWQRRLRGEPGCAAAHLGLGRAWARLMDTPRAAQHLRRYLDLVPADPAGAATELAALDGRDALPPDYVRCLFDQYAAEYDANMVETLGYRGPAALMAVLEAAGGPADGLRILDLGCGTGLMGPLLRPWAAVLAGIDLAPAMVERARARGLYDRLTVGDMGDALAAGAGAWDLITAADTLVYVGVLDDLLAAVARALRPGGRFAATVEQAAGMTVDLKPTRRFGHPREHVERAAAAAGLDVRAMQETSYRTERGHPVPGRAFVLQKRTRTR